jgi:uncharacterized protein (TIGR02145 family)
VNTPVELSFEGGYIPNTEIQLEQGWNLIPVLNNTPVPITKLFGADISKVEIVKDVIGLNLYWLDKGIFSLQELHPGESYFVKVSESFVISFANVNSFSCGDVFVDERDGQEYETVQIGEQCWIAENLAYLPDVSPSSEGSDTEAYHYVYDYQGTDVDEAKATENYQNYGALYNWPASLVACPEGWYLPSDDVWKILEGTVDSEYPVGDPEWDATGPRGLDAGKNLKSTTGWTGSGNGDDLYGFTALPGGHRYGNGNFLYQGGNAYWWSSTDAWQRSFSLSHKSHRYAVSKNNGYSVRCIKEPNQNLPPTTPSSPIPINGAVNQAIEPDLSWACYDPEGDQLTYDLFFGTDELPPQVTTGQTETSFEPGILESGTQYFWKVIASDGQGNNVEGPVWNFTTLVINLPPAPPSAPMPEDGAVNQSIESDISWECSDPENDPMAYIVFFGKDALPWDYSSIQLETSFDPGDLEQNTEYFWQIIVYDYFGNVTQGPVWSFTTEEE